MPLVKLVILGAPGVGKTSLIESFLGQSHYTESTTTLPASASSSSSARVIINPPHSAPSGHGEYHQIRSHQQFQVKLKGQQPNHFKQNQAPRREQTTGPPPYKETPADEPPVRVYRFSVVIDSLLVHVKVLDMPCISYFPNTAYHEWSDFRSCALRSANGYLLVFDLTVPGTLQYVKVIRDQLYESRDMHHVPVFIVGNKADLCSSIMSAIRSSHGHHHHHLPHFRRHLPFRLNLLQSSSSSGSSTADQRQLQIAASGGHHSHHHHHMFHHHHHHHEDFAPALKDLAGMVKKHWKCTYIECSAKYNWRVFVIFKELFKQMHNQILLMESSEASAASEPMHIATSSKSMESLHHATQDIGDSLKLLSLTTKSGGSGQHGAASSGRPGSGSGPPGGASSSGAHQRLSTSNQQNPSSSCLIL